jgi:hypothetical protein
MSKDIILITAIAIAAVLVMGKQKQAAGAGMTAAQKAAAGLTYSAAQQQSANMNGDMWTRLLGDGWRTMVSAQNSDGSAAFLKNIFGQVTTSDGKPVASGDPVANYVDAVAGFMPSPTTDYLSTLEPISSGLWAPIEW